MRGHTRRLFWAPVVCVALVSCARSSPPSFVLAVLDTTRADAVSAYGTVAGTTPTFDALAHDGLRYTYAYSNANWTLPAHASLFTGLLPSQHGVRYGSDALPEGVTTLAELLQQRGYETVAFSENPWLGAPTHTDRGFDSFPARLEGDIATAVGDWLKKRRADRPFFVFVNIMDAHWPYEVRATNPFLPAGVSRERAASVAGGSPMFCVWHTGDQESDILHGLYLGDVQAADAKLGRVLQQFDRAGAANHLVVIATSDHGEYLGEHGLLEHGLGMGAPVLDVPLVVHGLPAVAPAVIDTPVQLIDVAPSVLTWAGAPVPAGLAGRVLPTAAATDGAPRPIVAESWDSYTYEQMPKAIRDVAAWRRSRCAAEEKVFGDSHVLIRFPHKLVWYAQYTPELFDVGVDPGEAHDLASAEPALVGELSTELKQTLTAPRASSGASTSTLDPATAEWLRALGYAAPQSDSKQP